VFEDFKSSSNLFETHPIMISFQLNCSQLQTKQLHFEKPGEEKAAASNHLQRINV